jgi:hypothetical protein
MVDLVVLVVLVDPKVAQKLVEEEEMHQVKEEVEEAEVDVLVIQYLILLQTMTLPAEEQVVEEEELAVQEVELLVVMEEEVQMEVAILDL